jgi:hypothetical protein
MTDKFIPSSGNFSLPKKDLLSPYRVTQIPLRETPLIYKYIFSRSFCLQVSKILLDIRYIYIYLAKVGFKLRVGTFLENFNIRNCNNNNS